MSELIGLSLVTLLNAQIKRSQMLLVRVKKEEHLSLTKKRELCLIIVKKDSVVTTTPAGRKELESKENTDWRWAAGGGLMMLELKDVTVALARFRDPGAPSWGGHYTLGSGLSGSIRDLMFPVELAVREAVEEFIIATPKGLIVPVFNKDEDRVYNQTALGAVASGLNLIRQKPGLPDVFRQNGFFTAPAEFVPLSPILEADLSVMFEGCDEMTNSSGLLVYDPGTRGIDLIRLIRVKLPFSLGEIAIFDGEANRQEQPLDGEVVCFPVQNGRFTTDIVETFKTGKRVSTPDYPVRFTPPLQAVIEAM